MIFQTYEKMCQLMFVGGDDDYLFSHAFLTMEWNLMARSDNFMNMHLNHAQWQDYCLLFFFGKYKRRQNVNSSDKPWHVYSNPNSLHIFPVLSLTKYVCSNPDFLQYIYPFFQENLNMNNSLIYFTKASVKTRIYLKSWA